MLDLLLSLRAHQPFAVALAGDLCWRVRRYRRWRWFGAGPVRAWFGSLR